jgi:hypothetical protein
MAEVDFLVTVSTLAVAAAVLALLVKTLSLHQQLKAVTVGTVRFLPLPVHL